jgi:hypothetical protein
MESVNVKYDGGERREGLEALRLDLSVNTEARDCDRLAREFERLLAASKEGVEPDPNPGPEVSTLHRDRERELDRDVDRCARVMISIMSSSGTEDDFSTPQPTSHATSSTIAIDQRLKVERSRQPWRTSSAPRPMPWGTSYPPIYNSLGQLEVKVYQSLLAMQNFHLQSWFERIHKW